MITREKKKKAEISGWANIKVELNRKLSLCFSETWRPDLLAIMMTFWL